MRAPAKTDTNKLLDRVVDKALPGRHGADAWTSFLRAHATLMRAMDMDLERKTGMSLADFDVLAQLGLEGPLRMAELADRALISRSGMTRRVSRLVEEGLVDRATDPDDARVVVVRLTEKGVERLAETAPVHLGAVREMFVSQLGEKDLAVVERAMKKVTQHCSFG
jgi:DNA-binding MarR family transcriptional regulator